MSPEEAGSRLVSLLGLTSRGEKWIEAAEQVATILVSGQVGVHQLRQVDDRLIEWLLYGLNFEHARQQVRPITFPVVFTMQSRTALHAIS